MYFNRFYEFRERLKRCVNTVNKTLGDQTLLVGPLIKAFDKEFDQEIRARNRIHHHEAFDDLAFDAMNVASLMSHNERIGPGWQLVLNSSYRSSSKEWANRVQRRVKQIEVFAEAVAEAILNHCYWLDPAGTDE